MNVCTISHAFNWKPFLTSHWKIIWMKMTKKNTIQLRQKVLNDMLQHVRRSFAFAIWLNSVAMSPWDAETLYIGCKCKAFILFFLLARLPFTCAAKCVYLIMCLSLKCTHWRMVCVLCSYSGVRMFPHVLKNR